MLRSLTARSEHQRCPPLVSSNSILISSAESTIWSCGLAATLEGGSQHRAWEDKEAATRSLLSMRRSRGDSSSNAELRFLPRTITPLASSKQSSHSKYVLFHSYRLMGLCSSNPMEQMLPWRGWACSCLSAIFFLTLYKALTMGRGLQLLNVIVRGGVSSLTLSVY